METFLKKGGITRKTLSSLIQQLHDQLYKLNHSNAFHNDVKKENIVVRSTDAHGNLELSLIDYGLYTPVTSDMGSYYSMCISGCAKFFLSIEFPKINKNLKKLRNLIDKIKATNTDYVGFFNVIICLLNPDFCAWSIYVDILKIDREYNSINILNVLCLLCYVSNSAKCEPLFEHPTCISIVQKINTNLTTSINPRDLFRDFVPGDELMPVHTERRILFLSYLYFKITSDPMHRYTTFVHITKLPRLLWELSYCLDLQFNLKEFNANFGTIFNDQLLVPLPPPVPSQHPLPALPSSPSSPSPSQTVEKGNDISKFFN